MATASHAIADGRFSVAVRWRRASAGVVRIAISVVRSQILDIDDGVLLIGVVVDVRFVGTVRCVTFVFGGQAVGATEMMVEMMAAGQVMMVAGELVMTEMEVMMLSVVVAMVHGSVKVVRRC